MNDEQKEQIRKRAQGMRQKLDSVLLWIARDCPPEEPTEEEQKLYRAYAGYDYEPNDDTFMVRGRLSVNPPGKPENALLVAMWLSYTDCQLSLVDSIQAARLSMRDEIGYAIIN